MAFPKIPVGYVSIYGYGTTQSLSGVIPDDTKFKFAPIYGASQVGYISEGQSVMFNEEDVAFVLNWNGWPYTIIEENKIGGIDDPPL